MPRQSGRRSASSKPVVGPAVRRAGEAAAKATYKTLSPTVNKVKSAGTAVLKGYLNTTQKMADKIQPYASKLPKMPQSRGRRGR